MIGNVPGNYASREHPVRIGVESRARIEGASEEMMTRMKMGNEEYRALFLDCHDWSLVWNERVGAIQAAMRKELSAGPGSGLGSGSGLLMTNLVQILIRRTETRYGVSGGEHVALLVTLSTGCLLIDATHNQFDLPMAVCNNRLAVESGYRAVWAAMQTYIGFGRSREQAVQNWMEFLRTKPFMEHVFNGNIRYLAGNHDFRSSTSMHAEMRSELGGR
jgi:hypothetical protein